MQNFFPEKTHDLFIALVAYIQEFFRTVQRFQRMKLSVIVPVFQIDSVMPFFGGLQRAVRFTGNVPLPQTSGQFPQQTGLFMGKAVMQSGTEKKSMKCRNCPVYCGKSPFLV